MNPMIVIATPDEEKLIQGNSDDVFITGVGPLNVIEALKDVPRETPIFNIGYAGSNRIPIGTRCRIGRVSAYHPHADFRDFHYLLSGDVPCFTSSDFVTSAKGIEEKCVFDMELAYILALGFTNVTAEKIVSDNLSMEEYEKCLKRQP